ncbi:hypothetical protein [Chitinophaga qingshengii]|uniref:Uncharacterized protein n=1 Tax=Chitinophaga qingshengii TaxID=1569794 RepID=A0ABR7TTT5_9BACT|nr:hypothetical protein [Chitinophaga qingshengii]MBC9933450.1 hypothetical protein [Chitinophaga qingshengii]
MDPGPFKDRTYSRFLGGKLPGKWSFVPVLVRCEFDVKEPLKALELLVTFTPDGKEISRQEIGRHEMLNDAATEAIYSWPMRLNDTTIEVRETRTNKNPAIRCYVLAKDGVIRALPMEKTSFEEYTSRFPALQAPLAIGQPDITKLKKVSRLTPWMSYSEVISYDNLDVYHYGKVTLPGKAPLLLYAYGPTGYDEGEAHDSAVQVVACKPDGTATDQLLVYATISGEDNTRESRNAVIREDGTITLDELDIDGGEMALWSLGSTLTRSVAYRIDTEGKFKQEIRGITYRVSDYSLAKLKEVYETNKEHFAQQEEGHLTEMLFAVHDRMPLGMEVRVHFYKKGNTRLVELYTTDKTGKLLDRYALLNQLEGADYQSVDIPADGEIRGDQAETPYAGPITIHLGSTALQVTPEGKFLAL